ncbi:MAG: N-6 DNA methylase [Gemmatales bacterium]|nr:N-6 DNA methylase [Gemmatales bacterium]
MGGRKLPALQAWAARASLAISSKKQGEQFFFVLHTYFALLVKLLAWLALSRHMGGKLGGPSFAALATADSEKLCQQLTGMESGGIFRLFGISNLLEGDFFSWYLHAWDHDLESAVRAIIQQLDQYDPTTLSIVPEETRDLFKHLYHRLLPREIRHNLGEYYTPDWLAELVLRRADEEFFTQSPHDHELLWRQRLLQTRFLDPACGSGTFLVLVISRLLEIASALRVTESDILEAILRNVVGFDLNPLAVLTARVNYLLAIAGLLEHRRGEISIPVYLADSVRTPALGEDLHTQGAYQFPTAIGSLEVPAVLCTPERFDRFCTQLEEALNRNLPTDMFLQQTRSLVGNELWEERSERLVCELYEHLSALHKGGLNGLWARLLKNNFAPLTVGQFHYVVGNPP